MLNETMGESMFDVRGRGAVAAAWCVSGRRGRFGDECSLEMYGGGLGEGLMGEDGAVGGC